MKGLAAMSGVLGGLGISPTSRAKNGVGIFRVSGERAHGRPACPVYSVYHEFGISSKHDLLLEQR